MILNIKVIPGASREAMEWRGDVLKVKVTAPPEKGKANKAVEKYLARTLGLPASAVTIVSGSTSQLKSVEISTRSDSEILAALGQASLNNAG